MSPRELFIFLLDAACGPVAHLPVVTLGPSILYDLKDLVELNSARLMRMRDRDHLGGATYLNFPDRCKVPPRLMVDIAVRQVPLHDSTMCTPLLVFRDRMIRLYLKKIGP